jgi:hypothetical protein
MPDLWDRPPLPSWHWEPGRRLDLWAYGVRRIDDQPDLTITGPLADQLGDVLSWAINLGRGFTAEPAEPEPLVDEPTLREWARHLRTLADDMREAADRA